METMQVNGNTVELDGEGYLQNFDDWGEAVALALAESEKVEMTEDHWTVARLLRDYYAAHEAIPPIRDFSRMMAEAMGEDKGSSKYLATLYPNEPLKQGCKIAGLPRMPGCT